MTIFTVLELLLICHVVMCLIDESYVFCDRHSGCFNHCCDSEGEQSCGRTIYFGLMLAYPDPQGRASLSADFDDGHDIAPAAYLAVEQINNRSDLLSEHDIQLIQVDGGCTVTERTVIGINELSCNCKPIIGIVGPSCGTSAELVSQITGRKQFSLITIHYGERDSLGDRSKYPYAFGILGSSLVNAKAFVELMKRNWWTKVAVLYSEDNVDSFAVAVHIQQIIGNTKDFEVAYSSTVYDSYIPIQDLRFSFVRVIIILASPEITLRALCLAYYEGLVFPNYQWVFNGRFDSDFHEILFTYEGEVYSCSKADINISVKGSINLVWNTISDQRSEVSRMYTDTNLTYQEYLTRYDLQRGDYAIRFNVSSIETEWAKGFYDAVWSLAFALNDSLKELNMDLTQIKPGSTVVAQTIGKHMLDIDFQGISGRIKFDNKTGFNIDSTVNIYQYNENKTSTKVGLYVLENLTLLPNTNPMFITATFAGVYVRVQSYIAILFLVVVVASLLLALPAHVVSFVYRNHRAIKASSPRLSNMIFLGCYFILIGTSLLILTHSVNIKSEIKSPLCVVIPWILTPGTTLIIGTVCMKTWRLYRIHYVSRRGYTYDSKAQMHISDYFLSAAVLFMIAIDFIICLIWTTVDPLKANPHQEIIQEGDSLPVIQVDDHCQSEYVVYWVTVIVAYKGILTLCSLLLALPTRIRIKEFKTKNVIMFVYILSMVVGLGVPLYTIVTIIDISVTICFIVLCLNLDIVVYVCLFTLFLPPMIPLIKERFISMYTAKHLA